LRRKYDSTVRAWRLVFDPGIKSRIGYSDFARCAKTLRYEGSVRDLWEDISAASGPFITLNEFDHDAAEHLKRFQEHLVGLFKTAAEAFGLMDVTGLKTLKLNAFIDGCERVGFKDDQKHELHRLLFSEFLGKVSVKDIEWLGQVDLGIKA